MFACESSPIATTRALAVLRYWGLTVSAHCFQWPFLHTGESRHRPLVPRLSYSTTSITPLRLLPIGFLFVYPFRPGRRAVPPPPPCPEAGPLTVSRKTNFKSPFPPPTTQTSSPLKKAAPAISPRTRNHASAVFPPSGGGGYAPPFSLPFSASGGPGGSSAPRKCFGSLPSLPS